MTTEKEAHGLRLKTAMARAGIGRGDLADQLKVAPETVTNWRSGRTMPDLRQLHRLTEILGAYNDPGDPVEIAVRASPLTEDRQYEVIAFYKRMAREQRNEMVHRVGPERTSDRTVDAILDEVDAELAALPDERDERPPTQGGHSTGRAARRTDRD